MSDEPDGITPRSEVRVELTFQVEKYEDVIEEIKPFYPQHYEELASDKEVPLDPDYDAYEVLRKMGTLHVVTARFEKQLVGYHFSILTPHLHYRASLTAFTDIYYLRTDCRQGMNGINFLKAVERSLEALGVQRLYVATKTDADKGSVFRWMGYKEKERVYTKMLGAN